jgi:hypothetical protein
VPAKRHPFADLSSGYEKLIGDEAKPPAFCIAAPQACKIIACFNPSRSAATVPRQARRGVIVPTALDQPAIACGASSSVSRGNGGFSSFKEL